MDDDPLSNYESAWAGAVDRSLFQRITREVTDAVYAERVERVAAQVAAMPAAETEAKLRTLLRRRKDVGWREMADDEQLWHDAILKFDASAFKRIESQESARSVEAVADRLAELRASGQARAAAESMEAKETRVAAEAQAASARASRAETRGVPPHLRLGLTLSGMYELGCSLPKDPVERANAEIPIDETTGKLKYPANDVLNGYVNQHFITGWAAKGRSVCERLEQQGSPHVGEADVFVSWSLSTAVSTLLDALANYLSQHGLSEDATRLWVSDYVMRQTDVSSDLPWLGACVEAIGNTVLVIEPWHDPQPLRRAYCMKEVYHTQDSGARFEVVMSTAQQQAFREALVTTEGKGATFEALAEAVSQVDVEQVRTPFCAHRVCSPLTASMRLP